MAAARLDRKEINFNVENLRFYPLRLYRLILLDWLFSYGSFFSSLKPSPSHKFFLNFSAFLFNLAGEENEKLARILWKSIEAQRICWEFIGFNDVVRRRDLRKKL